MRTSGQFRTGYLSALTAVPVQTLQRLALRGAIPARRLPGSRANWRFSFANLPEIVEILISAGLVEEEAKPDILTRAATEAASDSSGHAQLGT